MIHASAYGRLGRDPKSISTAAGKAMTTASIACDVSTPRDPDGTHWLAVIAFGRQADILARHAKGDMLAVSGRLQHNAWAGQDGAAHIELQLVVDQVTSSRTVRPGGSRKRHAPGSKDGVP